VNGRTGPAPRPRRAGRRGWRLTCAAIFLTSCSPGSHQAFRLLSTGQCVGTGVGPAGPPPVPSPLADPTLAGASHSYFKISVADAATLAPVSGATLTLPNGISYLSDGNGLVAFYEPGLMGTTVFFGATHPAYQAAADATGARGQAFLAKEGGSGQLLMTQIGATPGLPVDDSQTTLLQGPVPPPASCFGVLAIDRLTRRGVPLVVMTTAEETFVTDSQGFVADCRPDHAGQAVTFTVSSDGYSLASGSATLQVAGGQVTTLELDRQNLAERLYRVTGEGIYRDSILLGLTTPLAHPVIDSLVMGEGLAGETIFKGEVFWVWNDAFGPSRSVGGPRVAGAVSPMMGQLGALDPQLGVNAEYFTAADGFAKAVIDDPAPTSTPIEVTSLLAVSAVGEQERLFAVYAKLGADLSVASRGLAEFNTTKQLFVPGTLSYAVDDAVIPDGEPILFNQAGVGQFYFSSPVRIAATAKALTTPTGYEAWTAIQPGTQTVLGGADGAASYAWRTGASLTTAAALASAGLGADQSLDDHVTDPVTGAHIASLSTAGTWNARRGRFVRILEQSGGTSSAAGEIWYLEGDTPMGPWVYARQILTHTAYGLLSPWVHWDLGQTDDRFVLFEGTYSKRLEAQEAPIVPRYDSNQMMYRLDVDDARLAVPLPVYDLGGAVPGDFVSKARLPATAAAGPPTFFAPDRAMDGTVPVAWSGPSCGPRALVVGESPPTPPLFFAAPPGGTGRPPITLPLYDYATSDGHHAYSIDATVASLAGYTRAAQPVAYVWPSPMRIAFPAARFRAGVVANAGADQCLQENQPDVGADATLDASGSSVPAGAFVTYSWARWGDSCAFSTDRTTKVHLTPGVTGFTLTVTDDAGDSNSDDVIVSVAAF
jgi:hypothetical protein